MTTRAPGGSPSALASVYKNECAPTPTVTAFTLSSTFEAAEAAAACHNWEEAVKGYRTVTAAAHCLEAPRAMCGLANAYFEGRGVAADEDVAVSWWKRSAALGHSASSEFYDV